MFRKEWEQEFLCAQNNLMQAQCMVCFRILATAKTYNIKRHYMTCHAKFQSYTQRQKVDLAKKLKEEFFVKISPHDNKITSLSKAKQKASYAIVLGLAKRCRPFEDGIFFKDMSKDVFECFGENLKEAKECFESIPLSRQTVTRRTEAISKHIQSMTYQRITECKSYSICLDESTDLNDLSQLIICIKTVDLNMNCFEELLSVVSFHSNVKGSTIYEAVQEALFSFAGSEKLSSVCTDGAKVMTGKKTGFAGCLLKNNINVPLFHCIIHQQVLFSKSLNLISAMKIAIKVINKIKGGHNSLSHRKFVSFLKDLDAEYGGLLLHTEVRWLSRGKSLQRLYDLRYEVIAFLEEDCCPEAKNLVEHLKDPNFLLDLGFLCDMTMYLNQLNLILQGKKKHIFELVFAVDAFKNRLNLSKNQLAENNLSSFPKTAAEYQKTSNNISLMQYLEVLTSIIINCETRFQDFATLKKLIDMHDNPLTCDMGQQPEAIQIELEILQLDPFLPLETGTEFWKNVQLDVYPNVKQAILKLYSMFGSTYICESAFSTLKLIQTKQRNKLSDKHISDLLRIKCYEADINIEHLVEQEQE